MENSAVLVDLYGNGVQTPSVLVCNKHQQFATADWCVVIHSLVMFCYQQNILCLVQNFYIQQLKNLDSTHPGTFEEICEMVSVRRNKTGIGQAIDLAREQTCKRNAKTAGFLLSLSNSSSFVYLK